MRNLAVFLILIFLIGCTPNKDNEITGQVVLEQQTAETPKESQPTTTCTDSDKGINPETAGKVSGSEPGGQYALYDRCIGDTNIIVEYYCEGKTPLNQNIRCTTKKGCLAGACR